MEVRTTTLIGLQLTLSMLLLLNYVFSNLPWYRLPNPGVCYSFLDHAHKFFTKMMLADPINGLWGHVQ